MSDVMPPDPARDLAPWLSDPQTISVDRLKEDHQRVHFFGLGFIQLKLTEDLRLHFYHPDLPPFVEHPHNHRYDFTSTVILGKLLNSTYYYADPGDDGEAYNVAKDPCDPSRVADGGSPETRVIHLKFLHTQGIYPGEYYEMHHLTLHAVRAVGPTITLLRRGPVVQDLADVTWPVGTEKVCPFSGNLPEARLWEVVESMLIGVTL